MTSNALLGPWVRRFLLEHLVGERNLSRNTQKSYRDALCLLIPFVVSKTGRAVELITVEDVSANVVRLFLTDLEQSRKCGGLRAISVWPRFTRWPASSASIARNTLSGAARSVRSPLRRPLRTSSRIWRSQKWTRCWRHPTVRQVKAIVITRFFCFSITPGLAPARRRN